MTNSPSKFEEKDDWPQGAIPKKWIERLFLEMSMAYGKKFSDQWGGQDPQQLKRFWAAKLGEFTSEDMQRGVEALSTREWPPTLPEFIKLCKPTFDALTAYYEAVAGIIERTEGKIGNWSHPAIYWASVPMAFDLQNQSYSQMKIRWEKSLSEQMNLGQWASIPEAMLALPAPDRSSNARHHAEKMMHQLNASEILKPRSENTAWYRNILASWESGEKIQRARLESAIEAAKNHNYPLPKGL